MCVQLLQSCLTLCHPMDCSLPGSSVHGILQARILEWVAMPSSGDLPNPEIKPMTSPASSAMQANSLPLSHPGSPSHFSQAWLFVTLWTWSTRLLCPQGSPGKNTRIEYHTLLQGIFPTQAWNQGLISAALAGRFFTTRDTYCKLSHLEEIIWSANWQELIRN